MDVRAQIAGVFLLDKCVGCHTCSVVCKNLWTDRRGAEHMWWNNVEARPGRGYPRDWEDQDRWRGGWERGRGAPTLRSGGRAASLARIFHNPSLPTLDDAYEPWTYRYGHLFDAPADEVQPTAAPVSAITGRPMDVTTGPNWDDDLGGSRDHAARDPGLSALEPEERRQLFDVERVVYFHLPRTCNHCVNPACVAACPSGAIAKRGEDGLVLVDQDRCRGWRMCVSACPYKKVFFNWATAKSEKCIGCYPRIESGDRPACYAACVGRIRYQGIVLYDADRIAELASGPEHLLVDAIRELLLDPLAPGVADAARGAGIPETVLDAASRSPALAFAKRWKLALPLHPEYRTLPMVFYVPPLLPLMAERDGDTVRTAEGLFASLDRARLPLGYLTSLFAAGNDHEVASVYRKLAALRLWRRAETVGDVAAPEVEHAFEKADLTRPEAEAIQRALMAPRLEDRAVVPPADAGEALEAAGASPGSVGFRRERAF